MFLGAELPCGDSAPENDLCEDAIPIATPVFIEGTTVGATTDGVPTCDGVENDGPGVWYKIIGGNKTYTASLCDDADFDTRISV